MSAVSFVSCRFTVCDQKCSSSSDVTTPMKTRISQHESANRKQDMTSSAVRHFRCHPYSFYVAVIIKISKMMEVVIKQKRMLHRILYKTWHYTTRIRIMILCLKASASPVHTSVLRTCRFLDPSNHHSASPPWRPTSSVGRRGLRLSWQQPKQSGFTSGRSGLPPWSCIVHEGLHPVELGC